MLSLSDLAPGLHGVQLHEVGDCGHGIAGVGGQIDGADLATLSVGSDGVRRGHVLHVVGHLAGLDDLDGVSLVVHALPDNRANIPARYQSSAEQLDGCRRHHERHGRRRRRDRVRSARRRDRVLGGRGRTGQDELHARGQGARDSRAAARRCAAGHRHRLPPSRHGRHHRRPARSHPPRRRTGIDRLLVAELTRLPGDVHGVQVHTSGACTGTAFADAGPKVSNISLPDVVTPGDLEGAVAVSLSTVELPSLASLLADDGASIVVHTDADNHANIPTRYTSADVTTGGPDAATQATGDAGAGLLCGTLRAVPPTERYIDGVYQVTLGRIVEPSAAATWTSYLQRHSRAAFVATINASTEARRLLVRSLYALVPRQRAGSGRAPYWSAQLGKPRFDQDTLEASLLASKRFYDQAGGTNGDYVEVLFDFLLFRGPTSGERSIWTTYLGRHGSRAAMARSLLATTEHRAMVVIDEYNMLLGRDPALQEIAIWATYLQRGGEVRALRSFLLASNEFYEFAVAEITFPGPI